MPCKLLMWRDRCSVGPGCVLWRSSAMGAAEWCNSVDVEGLPQSLWPHRLPVASSPRSPSLPLPAHLRFPCDVRRRWAWQG